MSIPSRTPPTGHASCSRAAAAGPAGRARACSGQPAGAARLALAASDGLFLARGAGERFTNVASGEAFGSFVDLESRDLWYSTYDGQARLHRLPLGGAEA